MGFGNTMVSWSQVSRVRVRCHKFKPVTVVSRVFVMLYFCCIFVIISILNHFFHFFFFFFFFFPVFSLLSSSCHIVMWLCDVTLCFYAEKWQKKCLLYMFLAYCSYTVQGQGQALLAWGLTWPDPKRARVGPDFWWSGLAPMGSRAKEDTLAQPFLRYSLG